MATFKEIKKDSETIGYLIDSESVEVFPCAYRGSKLDGTPFNKTAILNTEYNLTHIPSNGLKDSYMINTGNNTETVFALGGYYFRLNCAETALPSNVKYLGVRIGGSETEQEKVLLYVDSESTTVTTLDTDSDGTYYFHGLFFGINSNSNMTSELNLSDYTLIKYDRVGTDATGKSIKDFIELTANNEVQVKQPLKVDNKLSIKRGTKYDTITTSGSIKLPGGNTKATESPDENKAIGILYTDNEPKWYGITHTIISAPMPAGNENQYANKIVMTDNDGKVYGSVSGTVDSAKNVTEKINSIAISDIFDTDGKTALKAKYADKAESADNAATATNATNATKAGTADKASKADALTVSEAIGSSTKPIYISKEGKPVASSSTVGSNTEPVYLSGGVITKCTGIKAYSAGTAISIGTDNKINVNYDTTKGLTAYSGKLGVRYDTDGLTMTSSGALKLNYGTGLKINNGAVAVDFGTAQAKLTAGSGISLTTDNKISIRLYCHNISITAVRKSTAASTYPYRIVVSFSIISSESPAYTSHGISSWLYTAGCNTQNSLYTGHGQVWITSSEDSKLGSIYGVYADSTDGNDLYIVYTSKPTSSGALQLTSGNYTITRNDTVTKLSYS